MNVSARVSNRRLSDRTAAWSVSLREIVLLLAVATACALFYAFCTMQALDKSFEASQALDTQRELKEMGRQLQVELGSLSSPQRLERAGQRLGLAAPTAKQMRTLK